MSYLCNDNNNNKITPYFLPLSLSLCVCVHLIVFHSLPSDNRREFPFKHLFFKQHNKEKDIAWKRVKLTKAHARIRPLLCNSMNKQCWFCVKAIAKISSCVLFKDKKRNDERIMCQYSFHLTLSINPKEE